MSLHLQLRGDDRDDDADDENDTVVKTIVVNSVLVTSTIAQVYLDLSNISVHHPHAEEQ